jgi:hypothetical protein
VDVLQEAADMNINWPTLHLGWWSMILFLMIVAVFTGAAALNLRVG